MVVYGKLKDWGQTVKFYDQILPIELNFDIERSIIEKWHQYLKHYFSEAPNEKTWEYLILAIGYTTEISNEIIELTRTTKQNEKAMEIIKKIYEII